MRFADCVPILLFDPPKRVIGIVHAGWIGTVQRISAIAVRTMVNHFETDPSDVVACIGPSIAPEHYEIGEEVAATVRHEFPKDQKKLLPSKNGKSYFDLWEANKIALQESGVKTIEVACICTACNTNEWYSHRGENGKTGRFAAVMAL